MKKISFAILLLLAMTLPARVTLSRAVADAWAINRGLDSQKLEEQAAAVARQTALRRKSFTLRFNGGFRYSSDNIEVKAGDFPFPLGPLISADTVILATPNASFDLNLSLLQPLYTGGLLAAAVQMETARGAAEKELTRLKRVELAGRVKASYFNHLLLERKRDSLNSFLAGLDLHLKKVENLHAEEQVRKSDLLEARAKADEVRLNLHDLEQLMAAEAVQFRSLCGHEPDEVDFHPGADAPAFAAAWEYFLSRHPLLRSLDGRAAQVAARKRSAAAAYLPQVSAFAEAHYGRPGQNFFLNDWTLYFQGGLNFSLPVFNWNQRGRDLELAAIAGRKLENQRADFLRDSERELRRLYVTLESSARKLAILDGLALNAAEEVSLKEALYEEKQIDHTILLAAMANQERYLSNRGETLAQIEMLKAAIDTVIGRCEEEP